jgi:hypothetical protein
MQNSFNQATRRFVANGLLNEWMMEYSVDSDLSFVIEGGFYRNGKRASTLECAQDLAQKMFGSRDAVIMLNMAEYREAHEIAKLVGSPPGFVGCENDIGTLTRALREKPVCLLVLDELDKAHPDIRSMLKEAMAKEEIADSKGRTVSMKDVIPLATVMTSQQAKARAQAQLGRELAARATEGVPAPVRILRPLRYKGASFTTLRG